MQSKEYLKNKARKLAKQTWAGPGKFGVFIVICIIIVATFESLGLSNREKNLEIRNVQNIAIPVNIKMDKHIEEEKNSNFNCNSKNGDSNPESFNEKLKLSARIDIEKKVSEIDNLILFAAVDQFLFENQRHLANKQIDELNRSDKNKELLSLILKESVEYVQSQEFLEENSFYDM